MHTARMLSGKSITASLTTLCCLCCLMPCRDPGGVAVRVQHSAAAPEHPCCSSAGCEAGALLSTRRARGAVAAQQAGSVPSPAAAAAIAGTQARPNLTRQPRSAAAGNQPASVATSSSANTARAAAVTPGASVTLTGSSACSGWLITQQGWLKQLFGVL